MIFAKEFKGRSFNVKKGTTHPEHSISTFEEEADFKEVHWDPQEGQTIIDVGRSMRIRGRA